MGETTTRPCRACQGSGEFSYVDEYIDGYARTETAPCYFCRGEKIVRLDKPWRRRRERAVAAERQRGIELRDALADLSRACQAAGPGAEAAMTAALRHAEAVLRKADGR